MSSSQPWREWILTPSDEPLYASSTQTAALCSASARTTAGGRPSPG